MQTTDNTAIQPEVAAQIAVAAGAKLRNFMPEVHPGWLTSLQAPFNGDANKFPPDLLGEALLEQFDLRWPDLSTLTHPLQALWLLPKNDIVHFCQSRAIFERRGQLSRCMDSSVRRRVRNLIGDAAFEKILQVPFALEDSSASSIPVEPDALSFEGFNMLRTHFPSADTRHWRIAAMAFAPDHIEGSRADEVTKPKPKPEPKAGKHEFIELGAELYPEHAWLFGLKLGSRQ